MAISFGFLSWQFNTKQVTLQIPIPENHLTKEIGRINLWGDNIFNIKPTEVADVFLSNLQSKLKAKGYTFEIQNSHTELGPGHSIILDSKIDDDQRIITELLDASDAATKEALYLKFKQKLKVDLDRETLHERIAREAMYLAKPIDTNIQNKKIELLNLQRENQGQLPPALEEQLLTLKALIELGLTQEEIKILKNKHWKAKERQLAYGKAFEVLDDWYGDAKAIYLISTPSFEKSSYRFDPTQIALVSWFTSIFLILFLWLLRSLLTGIVVNNRTG